MYKTRESQSFSILLHHFNIILLSSNLIYKLMQYIHINLYTRCTMYISTTLDGIAVSKENTVETLYYSKILNQSIEY